MGENLIVRGLTRSQIARRYRLGEIYRVCQGLYLTRRPTAEELAAIIMERWPAVSLSGRSAFEALAGQELSLPLTLSIPGTLPASTLWTFHRHQQPSWMSFRGLRIMHPLLAFMDSPDQAIQLLEQRYHGRDGKKRLDMDLDLLDRLPTGARDLISQAAIGTDSWAERQVIYRLQQAGVTVCSNYVIGVYRWDIVIPRWKVAIEIDGHRHHSNRGDLIRDHWKRNDANLRGWLTLSYTGSCVKHNLPEVVGQILASRQPDLQARWHSLVGRWHGFFTQQYCSESIDFSV